MKVEIKDSNYITHINGNRPYKPSGNHFRRTFLPFDTNGYSYRDILDHVEDDNIQKANVVSEYFEDVGKDREMMQNKSFKYLTLWTTACFIHAVSHAIATQDTSFLVEEAPLIASVAGFLLSCGLTEKKLKEIADEKSQEALEVKSELRAEQKEQWDEKVRKAAEEERLKRAAIEEKFNATTDDLASTPGIEEISDPAKMAKA